MLVVLSEINCLRVLQGLNIYPDAFYTDYDLFKNQVITMKDVTVVVILAGTCSFNKRHTIEFCKVLRKYRKDENMGINHVYVITDSEIGNLDNYFKFTNDITDLTIMNGYKVVSKDTGLLKKLASISSRNTQTKVFLSDMDKGDDTQAVEHFKTRYRGEDDYIQLIQIPDIKKILQTK